MHIFNSINDLLVEIAQSADLVMKPWKYSALINENVEDKKINPQNFDELILKLECRDQDGKRFLDRDLDLEIFRSSDELNIILNWHSFHLKPILWQGKHSLWMDANSGKRSSLPKDGECLEALARRLRSRLASLIDL